MYLNGLTQVIIILSFAMLMLALSISTSRTVRHMIRLYQVQSYVLAGITLLIAIDPVESFAHILIGIFVIIPLFLAIIIEPLLAQATVPEDIPFLERMRRMFPKRFTAATHDKAIPIWLERRPRRRNEIVYLGFVLILIITSYIISFRLFTTDPSHALSLAVSFALLLLGLSIMSNKRDLISQVMGLLVMDHGLFLAAIQVIALLSVTFLFVISLFFYIIITLTILVLLLPELHRISGSIDLDDQKQLKG
jgi:hydrogenase-4 membrane subunit HyfE